MNRMAKEAKYPGHGVQGQHTSGKSTATGIEARPEDDQPREKPRGKGPDAPNNSELSAVLLPTDVTRESTLAKMEELFGSLDKSIENFRATQQQLTVYRQAILKWAFEGKLTNKNVADGELPEGWSVVNVGDVTKFIVSNKVMPKSFSGSTKWVTTPNLDQSSIRLNYADIPLGLTEDEIARFRATVIPAGSVIMTRAGTFGLSAIAEEPIVINQELHAFLCGADIDPRYLAYSIRSNRKFFEEKSTSAITNCLCKEDCNSMPFPLCPLPEQHIVVSEIESRLSVCDRIEKTIGDALREVESLRQSILKKGSEGKPAPQAPDDEPASASLARTKAESKKSNGETA